jgi:PhnB protein
LNKVIESISACFCAVGLHKGFFQSVVNGDFIRERTSMDRADQFIPHLCVSDGMAALEFYKSVFCVQEGDRIMSPDGRKLAHGEMVIDGHKCFLSDEFPEVEGGTVKTPQSLGGTSVRITLAVDNADAVVARAVAAGARVLMPVQDMFWGGRYGKVVDPFGHQWGINQPLREQSAEETKAAADAFFASRKLAN